MGTVDDFLAGLPDAERSAYEQVVAAALAEAPDAGQGTGYGMPALTWAGRPLLGFRVAKAHLSLVPFSAEAVAGARDLLAGFDLTKGTVHFTAAAVPPAEAVRAIVRLRRAEIVA